MIELISFRCRATCGVPAWEHHVTGAAGRSVEGSSSLSSTMPPSASYAAQHTQQPFPALYLYPLNDSFIPKHISLLAGQRVKIGRQTNPKTAPGEKNGFFDSKVLSRQHAEIWEDSGKVC